MTTFAKLDSSEMRDIHAGAKRALKRLELSSEDSDGSAERLALLDQYLLVACATKQPASSGKSDVEELVFECGCLWGTELIQALGWQWIRVQFSVQGPEAIGVASLDASLVIYPFQTIFYYSEQVLPVRVARSLEIMTQPGRVPMLPPAGLENVMDHID